MNYPPLILLFLFTSVPTFAFSDVNKSDWYEKSVSEAVKLGLLNGYNDGTFKPKNNITVAEFITITLNTLEANGSVFDVNVFEKTGKEEVNISYLINGGAFKITSFDAYAQDISNPKHEDGMKEPIVNTGVIRGKWYYNNIVTAIGIGLIDQNDFSMKDYSRNITRFEMAKILNNVINIAKVKPSVVDVVKPSDLSDDDFSYVNLTIESGIITGYPDKSFKPSKSATRAEAAVMILRLQDLM